MYSTFWTGTPAWDDSARLPRLDWVKDLAAWPCAECGEGYGEVHDSDCTLVADCIAHEYGTDEPEDQEC